MHRFFVRRYATLRLVRFCGVICRWLFSDWRLLLIGWAATAAAIWLVGWIVPKYSRAWDDVWTVLAIYAVFLFFYWVWQVRKRVVVEGFIDYTGQYKEEAPGLATLLVSNLQALGELYRDVDERRAVTTRVETPKEAINATIKVEDVGEILKGTVSAESKLSVGPIGIPVGAFLALLGRLVQGPRIVGSLHRDSGCLTLTALLTGAGRSSTWRVDRPIPSGADSKDKLPRLGDMVEELTYRIFSEAVQGASVRWRATKAFCEGLRKYRQCLITPKERTLNLQGAQTMFVEALSEDANFNLSYYNLGVVNLELGDLEAARALFLKTVELDPDRWESYYALAVHGSDPRAITRLCDRIISLKPHNAKAFNLKSVFQRRAGDLEGAIRNREKAMTLAWNELLRAEFLGKQLSEAGMHGVTQYLRNLAVAYSYQAEVISNRKRRRLYNRAVGLLRLAAKLNQSERDTWFECGKIFSSLAGASREALDAFENALRIDPRDLEVWSYTALMHAYNNRRVDAVYACEKVLDRASEACSDILERVAETYERLQMQDQAVRVRGMKTFLDSLSSLDVNALKLKLTEYDSCNLNWEGGHIAVELGRQCLKQNQFKEASDRFWDAIEKFQKLHPGEIRKNGLYVERAACLRQQKRWDDALADIKQALQQDPRLLAAHYERANIYFEMEDLPSAASGLREALLWHPEDSNLHWMMGVYHWRVAQHHGKQELRKIELQQAAHHLRQALDLEPSGGNKAQTHYWLGKLHHEQAEYTDAVPHLRIVEASKFAEYLPRLFLGQAYLRSAAYNECEEQFSGLVDKLNARLKGGDPIDSPLDEPLNDPWPLGLVLAWSYWGLCYSRALRDVKLKDSLALVEQAVVIAKQVDDKVGRDRCLAGLADCNGWLFYKLGTIVEAISSLEESVSLVADAETYLHLGLACECSLSTRPENEIPLVIDRARACAEHTQSLDVFGIHSQKAQELLARLDKISLKVKPPETAPKPPEAPPKPSQPSPAPQTIAQPAAD